MEQVLRGRVRLLRLRERQTEGVVDHLPPGHVGPVDECDRHTGRTGPAGPTDPVHVGLVVVGALVVDHVRDPVDVDAAGGDVGRHEHVDTTGAETLQRLLPEDLAQITVDGGRREASLGQVVGEPLSGALGPAEDHHPIAVLRLQDAGDDLGLVQVVHLVDELRGRRHRHRVPDGLGPDVHRVTQVATGQSDDRGRHGRGEQHRLTQLGRLGQDPLHVGKETQVQHLVGLVEDEHLDVAQVQRPAVGQVEQSPRGADDDLDAAGQGVQLGVVADAAVDGEDPGLADLGGDRHVLAHLQRELAGRGDDQGLRGAGLRLQLEVTVAADDDPLQSGDAEGECLAGSGAGLADHVGAGQRDGDGHLLDREGVDDVHLGEGVHDIGQHSDAGEGRQLGGSRLDRGCGGGLGSQDLVLSCATESGRTAVRHL